MDETTVKTKPDWLNNRAKVAGERTEDVVGDDDEACDVLSVRRDMGEGVCVYEGNLEKKKSKGECTK